MPTRSVNLSEQQAKFIRRNIEKGHYQNTSEVVRAGLRLLEQQERHDAIKVEALRRIAKEAFEQIDRGDFESVAAEGIDAFLSRVDARVRNAAR